MISPSWWKFPKNSFPQRLMLATTSSYPQSLQSRMCHWPTCNLCTKLLTSILRALSSTRQSSIPIAWFGSTSRSSHFTKLSRRTRGPTRPPWKTRRLRWDSRKIPTSATPSTRARSPNRSNPPDTASTISWGTLVLCLPSLFGLRTWPSLKCKASVWPIP